MEVGGGVGHNAAAILDWFASAQPAVYETMKYTLLDVSREQASFQARAVARRGHASRCRVVVCPEARWARAVSSRVGRVEVDDGGEGGAVPVEVVVNDDGGGGEYGDDEEGADEDVFVLALELADNLAHDKVTVVPSTATRGEDAGTEGKLATFLLRGRP